MRKIIVLSFITLDGVMQAPGGPKEDTSGGFQYGGWTVPYFDEFSGNAMGEQMSQPFELLLGRRTYEIFAAYWPHHEENWPGVNAVKKYVASRSQRKLKWNNSKFRSGCPAAAISWSRPTWQWSAKNCTGVNHGKPRNKLLPRQKNF